LLSGVYLECIKCGEKYESTRVIYTCENCGGLLDVKIDYDALSSSVNWDIFRGREFSVWRYRELLPVNYKFRVSLHEGGTPLYRCDALAKEIGVKDLYVKFEGGNPTGSFKDRGMTVGVSKAKELGVGAVGCASTGNTSASLAAYAARAGLRCFVLLPSGKVAMGKLAQAIMYGAKVISVRGNFDEALNLIRAICDAKKIYLLNSINPWRLEGQKTAAYEITDQLDKTPDRVILPMGNCGNISAIWKGFKELYSLNLTYELPMMTGIQASGAAPVAEMIKNNLGSIKFVERPETIATAIRIGKPVNWPKAVNAIKESNGTAETVTDEEIIKAQKDLAKLEGIGVEPASAASIAGLRKLVEAGVIDRSETIVCITTGHVLKDPQEAIEVCEPIEEADSSFEAVNAIIERYLETSRISVTH